MRITWALGLQRLGFDVWLVEQVAPGQHRGIDWFDAVTSRFGLGDRSGLIEASGRVLAGPGIEELEQVADEAELLVNISGNLTFERLARAPRNRVYVDLDPGYTQFWHAAGHLGDILERHEIHLTVGLAVGRPGCSIPTAGIHWRPVKPPVLLDEWRTEPARDASRLTTVGSWRGGYGRVEQDGTLYGQKAHEFRRFADLPLRVEATCEAALAIEPADAADSEALVAGGWRLVDPFEVAGDPDAYREYIQGSGAELSTAQGIYVATRSGWFSDRTACYLAAGRPAVVQETGLGEGMPTGEGLLTFTDPSGAAAAIAELTAEPTRHAAAARAIAEEHLDASTVLAGVLEEALA